MYVIHDIHTLLCVMCNVILLTCLCTTTLIYYIKKSKKWKGVCSHSKTVCNTLRTVPYMKLNVCHVYIHYMYVCAHTTFTHHTHINVHSSGTYIHTGSLHTCTCMSCHVMYEHVCHVYTYYVLCMNV